jgi:hypothetical protein
MGPPTAKQVRAMREGYKRVYPYGFKAFNPTFVEGTIIGENYGLLMTHMQAREWNRQYSSQLYISPSCANTTIEVRAGKPVPLKKLGDEEQKLRKCTTRWNKGKSLSPSVYRPFVDPNEVIQNAPAGANVAPPAQQQGTQDVPMGSNDDDAAPPQGIDDAYVGYNEFAPDAFPGGYYAPVAPQQYSQAAPMGQTFDFAAAQAQGILFPYTGFNNGFAAPPQDTKDVFPASNPVDTAPVGDFQGIVGDFPYLPELEPQGNLDAFGHPSTTAPPPLWAPRNSAWTSPPFVNFLANEANWETQHN